MSEDEISDSEVDTDHEEDASNSNEGDVNEGGVLPHQFDISEYVNDGECYRQDKDKTNKTRQDKHPLLSSNM